ncbi:ATP-binding protein [Pseudomaricurvus sp. HS19]|uniref:sensor histidine kinase n=1 Tax=Pseudomaricurvus sp. HS19 TaxID=2692626 RepID=UPI00136BE19A|nr:histidine kinase [Pseudomaricurvus sp. HS19]
MGTKLKQWLPGWHWSPGRRKSVARESVAEVDYGRLALQLATAERISEELPAVLQQLQPVLNSRLPHHPGSIQILLSHPNHGESILHHGQQSKPASSYIAALHRQLSSNRGSSSPPLRITDGAHQWQVIARELAHSEQQRFWLLFAFEGEIPALEQLNWRTCDLERCLQQGIEAWVQREEKVREALQAERAIYAAELHDSLAQILGYLRLKSARLHKQCQAEEYAALQAITEELASCTHCAYRQTRELITTARLTQQSESLSQGVINSIREFEQQSAIVFELDNRLQRNLLSPQQTLQALYIIRESLSNVVRHSHATHARVTLSLQGKLLQATIEDNGTGIDPQAARPDSFGLQIMRERAERIGGTLNITPRPAGGTSVCLQLDLDH